MRGADHDKKEIEKLYWRAIRAATILGHDDIAEDFGSWITIKWLEGKSQHQTIAQSLIDFLRAEYGNAGKRCGADAILRARRAPENQIPGSAAGSNEEAAERVLSGVSLSNWNDRRFAGVNREPVDAAAVLPDRLAEIWKAYTEEEITYKEIGDRLGITESRVAQLFARSKDMILNFEGLREMRRRIEENRTTFEIEWITL